MPLKLADLALHTTQGCCYALNWLGTPEKREAARPVHLELTRVALE